MSMASKEILQKNIKTFKTIQSEVQSFNRVALSVDCVIFGFDENKLKVLVDTLGFEKISKQMVIVGGPGKASMKILMLRHIIY